MEGIKDTILKFLRLDNLASNVTGYVETRVKLLKIEIKEDVAKVLSKGLAQATIIFFAFLFLIFLVLVWPNTLTPFSPIHLKGTSSFQAYTLFCFCYF